MKKRNETQERNTPTSQIIGENDHKGKNTPARKPIENAQDKGKFSLNADLKGSKGDPTADESSKKEWDEQQSDLGGLPQKIFKASWCQVAIKLSSLMGI